MANVEGVAVKYRSEVMLYPLRKKSLETIEGSDGEPIEGTEEE